MADIINLSLDGSNDRIPNMELIELLFFAYRDFVSEPDEVLLDYGFGRAHHRVLHFVGRHPGICVADLLEILNITKQSLARVLRQLVETGFVEQRTGANDRRQRLLLLTEQGRRLAQSLADIQSQRISAAVSGFTGVEQQALRKFFTRMTNEGQRDHARGLTMR